MLFPISIYFTFNWFTSVDSFNPESDWFDSGIHFLEKMMIFKKLLWGGFFYHLGGGFLFGLAGFIVFKPLIGFLPGIVLATIIAILEVFGMLLNESTRAFQKNTMFEWLMKHPQRREVLDEFDM